MKCDKFTKKRAFLCEGNLIAVICACGRTFTRCIGGHDGAIGGHRSLHSHRVLSINAACQQAPKVMPVSQ